MTIQTYHHLPNLVQHVEPDQDPFHINKQPFWRGKKVTEYSNKAQRQCLVELLELETDSVHCIEATLPESPKHNELSIARKGATSHSVGVNFRKLHQCLEGRRYFRNMKNILENSFQTVHAWFAYMAWASSKWMMSVPIHDCLTATFHRNSINHDEILDGSLSLYLYKGATLARHHNLWSQYLSSYKKSRTFRVSVVSDHVE